MMFLLVVFWFLVRVNFVESLKVTAEDLLFAEDNATMKRLHSMFVPSHPICLLSAPSENNDILELISKEFSTQTKLVIVETSFNTVLNRCKNVLLLDIPSSSLCDLFSSDTKTVYLSVKHNVVLVHSRSPNNLTTLQSCSSSFDLALVRVLSWATGQVFVLNSPLDSARMFVPDVSTMTPETDTPIITSLRGRHLRVATFNYPPFTIIRESNNNVVEYDGMEMNLFHQVSQYLNFSWGMVELKEPRPWGTLLPNNTVVGGLEQALQEDADVAFCNYWHRWEFLNSMDFGPPLNELYLTFLVRRPQREHSRWQTLVAIFSREVWSLALLAFVSVTVTFWLWRSVHVSPATTRLSESALIIFGMLTSSSSPAGPPCGLLVWWSFFALLFTTALTGSVVTRLAVPLFSPRLDTYRQAVEGGYYWVDLGYSNRSSYLTSFMFNLHNSWQKKFAASYRNKEAHEITDLIKSDPKIMMPVQRWGDDFVILDIMVVNSSMDMSDFRVMRETTRDVYTSFVFKKESPLNEMLSVATQSLIERGHWDYWKRAHTTKGEPKLSKQLMLEKDLSVLSQPEPFTLLKLYPLFVQLVIGNAFASVVFLIELCCYRFFL